MLGSASACHTPGVNLACKVGSGLVHSVVGRAVNDTAGRLLQDVIAWVVSGAVWLLDRIGAILQYSSQVHLGAPWFLAHERVMTDVAALFVLPLLLVTVIQSILRQDPRIALRAAFVQLPLALLLSVVAVQLVQMGLHVTDQLSSGVAAGSGRDLHHAFSHLAVILTVLTVTGHPGGSSFIVFLIALMLVVGAFVLWLELLIRTAAIYVAVLFIPLAMASLVWPAISHWARRLTEMLAALVLSKFVIVAILSLGTAAVASGTGGVRGVTDALAGAAMLLLAAMSPFVLLRLVPVTEAALIAEGARQRLQTGATMVPRSAAKLAMRAASGLPIPGSVPGTDAQDAYPMPGAVDDGAADPSDSKPSAGGGRALAPSAGSSAGDNGAGANRSRSAASSGNGSAGAPSGSGDGGQGIPDWQGQPASNQAYDTVVATGATGQEFDTGPGLGLDSGAGVSGVGGAARGGAGRGGDGDGGPGRLGAGRPRSGSQGWPGSRRTGAPYGPPVYGASSTGIPDLPGGRPPRGWADHVIDNDGLGPVIREVGATDHHFNGEGDESSAANSSGSDLPKGGE